MNSTIRAGLVGCGVFSLFLTGSAAALELPSAEPGECYAKVLVPAEFETRVERFLVQPSAQSLVAEQASYRTLEKEIVIKEETVEYTVVPGRYETREERVLISPEKKIVEVVPPTFRDVEERVLVTPARYEWKPGRGPYQKLDLATGEILCRVEIPAVYRTVTKRVVDQPARTQVRTVPARYKKIRKRVVVTEPRVQKRVIPAVTRTIKVEELVRSEEVTKVPVEPIYKTYETRVKVADEKFEYRAILCETNATKDVIRKIQYALKKRGYYTGRIDGDIGQSTLVAIKEFQQDNRLEVGNLTLKTIKALGVDL